MPAREGNVPRARDSSVEVGWQQRRRSAVALVAASTVRALKRFQACRLSWPLPELTDATLEPSCSRSRHQAGSPSAIEPDWASIHRELKRKHVTLSSSGTIHRTQSEGYRYSRFCELYRSWEGGVSVTMRQTHVGGDKLFVVMPAIPCRSSIS